MSATDSGSQVLGFDYQQPAKSSSFNRGWIDLIPRGVFTGMTLTKVSGTTIKVTSGTVYIHDLENNTGTRIETTTDSNVITPTASALYIVARFNWANVANNYMDFLPVGYADSATREANYTGSGTEDTSILMRDDIILGKTILLGGVVQTDFDLTRREDVFQQDAVTKHEYFKVKSYDSDPDPSGDDLKRVWVEGGVLFSSEGRQNITGAKAPTNVSQIENPIGTEDYIEDTTNGRIDLVYIDESGGIKFVLGTDASSPVVPDYGNRKVIAEIRRGAGATTVTGDDIFWIDRSERGTILTSSLLISDTNGLYTSTNVDDALDEIAGSAFTFEGLKKFSDSIYIIDSSTSTLRLDQGDSGTIYSDLYDSGSNSLYIQKNHSTDSKIRLNPTEASGSGTAYISMFQDTTSGTKGLQLYRGDGTSNIDMLFGVDGLDSYINNLAKFGFWTTSPSAQFDIRANVNIGLGKFLGFNVYGTAEASTVTTVADVAGSLDAVYFTINSPTTSYYVWIDVDNGSVDPSVAGKTGIEVDISTGDSANDVATAVATAVNAVDDFIASSASNVVTITNLDSGSVTDVNAGTSTFTVAVTVQGVNKKHAEAGYASYLMQRLDTLEIYLADTDVADDDLNTPVKFLDFDYGDSEINFYVDLVTSTKGVYFTGTGADQIILSMSNGWNFITVNETSRNLLIKAGIDESHNIVTGSGAGGSYIQLTETGGIKLSINGESEGNPALDTYYLELTSSICKLAGVNLEVPDIYFDDYTNNDYITFDSGTDKFQFYANNTIATSIVEAGAFNTVSSRIYKTMIEEFKESALDLISQIDVVSYYFKKYQEDDIKRVGFIAEDTHPYFSGKEQKNFDIANTLGIVLKAIQELNEKIERL